MEYYSAIKKDEIMKFIGKWMKVEKSHSNSGNPDPKG